MWLRIPTWCGEQFVPGELYSYADNNQSKVVAKVNGKRVRTNVVDGYMPVQRTWQAGDKVEFELPMPVRYSVADERVEADVNRVCITRGPLVYCAEQPDNEFVASTYVVKNIGDHESRVPEQLPRHDKRRGKRHGRGLGGAICEHSRLGRYDRR